MLRSRLSLCQSQFLLTPTHFRGRASYLFPQSLSTLLHPLIAPSPYFSYDFFIPLHLHISSHPLRYRISRLFRLPPSIFLITILPSRPAPHVSLLSLYGYLRGSPFHPSILGYDLSLPTRYLLLLLFITAVLHALVEPDGGSPSIPCFPFSLGLLTVLSVLFPFVFRSHRDSQITVALLFVPVPPTITVALVFMHTASRFLAVAL